MQDSQTYTNSLSFAAAALVTSSLCLTQKDHITPDLTLAASW